MRNIRRAAIWLTCLALSVAGADNGKNVGVNSDTASQNRLTTATRVLDDGDHKSLVETGYITTKLPAESGLETLELGFRYGSSGDDLLQFGIRPSLRLDGLIVRPIVAGSHRGDNQGGKVQLEAELRGHWTLIVGGTHGKDSDGSRLNAGYGIYKFPAGHILGVSHLEYAGESGVRAFAGLDLTSLGQKDLTIGGGTHFAGGYFAGIRQAGKDSLAWRAIAHFDPADDVFSLGEGLNSVTFFVTDSASNVTKAGFISPAYYTAVLPYIARLKGEGLIVDYNEFFSQGLRIPDDGERGRFVLAGKLTERDEVFGAYWNPLYNKGARYIKTYFGASYGLQSESITPTVQIGIGPFSIQAGHTIIPGGEDTTFLRIEGANIRY